MTSGNDFKKVPQALEEVVKDVLDLELVEMKNDARRPTLPFATYDVVNPYLPHSYRNSPADGFSIQIQLGIHGIAPQDTLQKALELRASLERSSVIEELALSGVHLERILDVYNRPTLLIGQAYEYVTGIDLQLGIDVGLLPDDAPDLSRIGFTAPNNKQITL